MQRIKSSTAVIITNKGEIFTVIDGDFNFVEVANTGDRVSIYYPTHNDDWILIQVNDRVVADRRNIFTRFADWILNVFGTDLDETYRRSAFIFDEGSLQST